MGLAGWLLPGNFLEGLRYVAGLAGWLLQGNFLEGLRGRARLPVAAR